MERKKMAWKKMEVWRSSLSQSSAKQDDVKETVVIVYGCDKL